MALATLRSEKAGLVRLANNDLTALWRLISEGAAANQALHDLLPAIVRTYGEAGAALAADWYDDQRDRAGARRSFTAVPLEASDRGANALVGWALDTARDDSTLKALILGGVQRRIADHVRLTVANSSVYDPAAQGWIRVGHGPCDWCNQYLDGEIRTVEGYDFDAHDNCECDTTPVFY